MLDQPEVLWKAYIDFELQSGEHDRVRELYKRLLQRTKHVKVWISRAQFEATVKEVDRARAIFREAEAYFKQNDGAKEEVRCRRLCSRPLRPCPCACLPAPRDAHCVLACSAQQRVMLLESWLDFEKNFGGAEAVKAIADKLPRKVKKRRELQAEDGVRSCLAFILRFACSSLIAQLCPAHAHAHRQVWVSRSTGTTSSRTRKAKAPTSKSSRWRASGRSKRPRPEPASACVCCVSCIDSSTILQFGGRGATTAHTHSRRTVFWKIFVALRRCLRPYSQLYHCVCILHCMALALRAHKARTSPEFLRQWRRHDFAESLFKRAHCVLCLGVTCWAVGLWLQ